MQKLTIYGTISSFFDLIGKCNTIPLFPGLEFQYNNTRHMIGITIPAPSNILEIMQYLSAFIIFVVKLFRTCPRIVRLRA